MTSAKMVGAAAAGLVLLLLVWELAPARWGALLLLVFTLYLAGKALTVTQTAKP